MKERKIEINEGEDQNVRIYYKGKMVASICVWGEITPNEKATVSVHAINVRRVGVCVKSPEVTKSSIDGSIERHEWIHVKEV